MFYLNHSPGCFKYPAGCFNNPAGCFFPRPDVSIIRPEVFLDNTFAIQYQNTRLDLSDNLVINLHYLVCKLCSRTIRPGIYDTCRNKNQIIRMDTLNYPAGLFIYYSSLMYIVYYTIVNNSNFFHEGMDVFLLVSTELNIDELIKYYFQVRPKFKYIDICNIINEHHRTTLTLRQL